MEHKNKEEKNTNKLIINYLVDEFIQINFHGKQSVRGQLKKITFNEETIYYILDKGGRKVFFNNNWSLIEVINKWEI